MMSDPGAPLSRRDLLKTGAVVSIAGLGLAPAPARAAPPPRRRPGLLIASTWPFGLAANARALEVFGEGKTSLDALEQGIGVVEADPAVGSVGYGGVPNRDGVVELDAACMRGRDLACGAVAALQDIKHPVAVARKVMELTRHILLVGAGARSFALAQGFKPENLLAPEARRAFEERAAQERDATPGSAEDHDTIGMIALDAEGDLAAAVSTSGLGFKLPGRVGDSPLIGCGLYADSTAGACVSTGVGEEAIRVLGSFLTVETMRRGADPLSAVMETLGRVRAVNRQRGSFQLAFLAVSPEGAVAGGALEKGFSYALTDLEGRHELIEGTVL